MNWLRRSLFGVVSSLRPKVFCYDCAVRKHFLEIQRGVLRDGGKRTLSSIRTQFLDLGSGRKLAYKLTEGDPKKPTVDYVAGLMKTMEETKAVVLHNYCKANQVNLIRFDFEGIGESPGSIEKVYFGQWIEDLENVVDKLCKTPVILVGFSMGGWISTSVAIKKPAKLHSILYVAPGFNFLDHYYNVFYQKLSPEQQKDLEDGKCIYYNDLFMRKDFAAESIKYHIDIEKPIPINVPIRIIHGVMDRDAPYFISLELINHFESLDVDIYLRKSGKHHMIEPKDLELLKYTLEHLIQGYPINK